MKNIFLSFFHSAVHELQHGKSGLLFIVRTVDGLFYHSSLFKARIVMNQKIVFEEEASVANVPHLTDDAKFLVYRIDGNAAEIFD